MHFHQKFHEYIKSDASQIIIFIHQTHPLGKGSEEYVESMGFCDKETPPHML